MGAIWLTCCTGAEIGRVRREIEGRDAGARLLRTSDLAGLMAVADVMAGVPGGVAICAHGDEGVEEAVGRLVEIGCAQTVLVFIDEADAGHIARLFFAGATEVIAVEGSADADPRLAACAGEGSALSETTHPTDDDGLDPKRNSGPAGAARDAATGPPDQKEPAEGASDAAHVPAEVLETGESPAEPAGQDAPAEDAGTREEVDHEGDFAAVPGSVSARPPAGAEGPADPGAPFQPEAAPPPDAAGGPVPDGRTAGGGAPDAAPAPTAPAPAVTPPSLAPRAEEGGHAGAPLVVAISGRGGVGKTTVLSAMAWQAARMGLRAAVVDLDLMFGNMHALMGVERTCDLSRLVGADGEPTCTQETVEATAMRIVPGLTLWGPCFAPEYAELLSRPTEELIDVLRREADVIFADTSVFWGDAVASAVSRCDRCLVVGTGTVGAETSTVRAVALATRIGVPKTRMTCLFNRFGAPGSDEERALRFEMAVALRSRLRIADGGQTVHGLLSFGKLGDLMAASGPFARDIQQATYGLLKELGCPLDSWEGQMQAQGGANGSRSRIKLPWKHGEGSGQ